MKHDTFADIAKEDYKYIIDKPDRNFSPERNYAVIKQVIDEGIRVHETLKAAQRKETEERVDILSTYGRHALNGGEKTLEKFMGKDWMKRIYGEKLIEKIQIMDSIKRLNRARGNTQFEDFYLT